MKEGEEPKVPEEAPKAERLDASMTIVTGRRIVIDKETGQITLEEVAPTEPASELEDKALSRVSSEAPAESAPAPADTPFSYSIPVMDAAPSGSQVVPPSDVSRSTGTYSVPLDDISSQDALPQIAELPPEEVPTEETSTGNIPLEAIQVKRVAEGTAVREDISDSQIDIEQPDSSFTHGAAMSAPIQDALAAKDPTFGIPGTDVQSHAELSVHSASEQIDQIEAIVTEVPQDSPGEALSSASGEAVSLPVMPPAASGSDMERTMAQPPPQGFSEAVAASNAKPEEVPPVDTGSKSNKRLSAETLFAFALPEPVLQKAIKDAKSKSAAQQKASQTAHSGLSMSKVLMGLAALLLAVGAGSYLLAHRQGPANDIMVAITDTNSATASSAVAASQQPPREAKTETPKAPAVTIPADPVSAEQAAGLRPEQLTKLLASKDPITLGSVIKEIGQRKTPDLIGELLVLANNENYIIRATVVKLFTDKSMFVEPVSDKIVSVLLERLDDTDEIVRGFAARALAQSGDNTVLQNLKGRLDAEQSKVVQKALRASIDELSKKKK